MKAVMKQQCRLAKRRLYTEPASTGLWLSTSKPGNLHDGYTSGAIIFEVNLTFPFTTSSPELQKPYLTLVITPIKNHRIP